MEHSEGLLLQHLNEFRRKYYINQIIRGGLISLLIISSLAFLAITGEGLLGFSSGVRTVLMSLLGITFLGVMGTQVVWPASKLFHIAKPISDMEIARMVRKHFPDIDDKLLNLLELKGTGDTDNSLAIAAIQKKTEELAPIPFSRAINLKLNTRYLRYLAVPFGLFLLIGFINPDILKQGSVRLINFRQDFVPPPPFFIDIVNHPDQLISGQSFDLQAKLKGNEFPEDLFLYLKKDSESDFINYPMEKITNDNFHFELNDLKENFVYKIGNEEVISESYDVEVLRRPSVRNFRVVVNYPGYTGLGTDTLSDNVGDFKVLRGSKVTWLLDADANVRQAQFVGKETVTFNPAAAGQYQFSKNVLEEEKYYISLLSDRNIGNADTVRYSMDVIQDRFPSVYVNGPGSDFEADFRMVMPLDFEISDDYGFSKLSLFYRYASSADGEKVSPEYSEIPLNIVPREVLQHKELEVDLSNLGMDEGDQIEYYVKVWDNDYVSGFKSSTSAVFTVNYASINEKFEEVDQQQDDLKEQMAKIEKDVSDIKEGIEKFEEKLLNQNRLSYDDKKELQNLAEKHEQVKEQINELKNNFQQNKEMLKNYNMVTPETLEKYERLNEMIQKMENKKLDEMMKKLRDEMEKIDPEKMKEMMDEIKFDEEEMRESMERTEELMKQLAVEQKMEEVMSKIDNMKLKQDLLNEKLENTDKNDQAAMDQLAEQQEKLAKEMEDLKKDLKELAEMKQDTQTPDGDQMKDMMEDADGAQQDMDNAEQQIGEQNKSEGSKSQQKASDKLEKMQESMQGMMSGAQQQQDQQNMDDLRDLLENLLKLSFDQEDLRDEVEGMRANDPMLVEKGRQQKQLLDDMYMVKDSLDALAKRVFQIEKFVIDESNTIIKSMRGAKTSMETKNIRNITQNQHQAMTSTNNLANMLSDVMDQMQQQMKAQNQGQSQCTKPGNGKPNMQQLSQQQKQLNQQMKGMMDGSKGMDPKKLAEMAKQQESIRKALQEAHEKIQQEGGKELGDLSKIMDDMEETEKELERQQLTQETMYRQQQILNRLLDSFKSVREKEEFENSRESNTGREEDRTPPSKLDADEYKNKIRQELLKSNQLEYSNDFIILIEKYFKLLETSNGQ